MNIYDYGNFSERFLHVLIFFVFVFVLFLFCLLFVCLFVCLFLFCFVLFFVGAILFHAKTEFQGFSATTITEMLINLTMDVAISKILSTHRHIFFSDFPSVGDVRNNSCHSLYSISSFFCFHLSPIF